MAVQVQQFAATVPAATTKTAPQITQMQLGVFEVEWVEVQVPDGANGQVGFYVASSGQQVFPFRAGSTPIWVVSNNRVFHWDVTGQPTSGDWQLYAYNSGTFPHTVTCHFGVSPVTVAAAGVTIPAPIAPNALSGP
jgi:hypothetical protein